MDRAEREEYHRLLYVAMTRAQDRLYICGWEGTQKREKNCWYDLIKNGLGPLREHEDCGGKPGGRLACAQAEPVPRLCTPGGEGAPGPLPAWGRAPAPRERPSPD